MSRNYVCPFVLAALALSAWPGGAARAQARPGPTPRDVLGAYGLGPNAGLGSGAPLYPRYTPPAQYNNRPPAYYPPPAVNNPPANYYSQLSYDYPNYYGPVRINDAAVLPPDQGPRPNPLFPYASAGWPYGYGQPSRDFNLWYFQHEHERIGPERGPAQDSAKLDVRVPADAVVWVEGQKTAQTGADRVYVSPPLEPGKEYLYDVKARWERGGKPVERTRTVRVRAGQRVPVEFADDGR
jgi:uncharacterized protein (TIGR03000 family)